MIGGIPLYNGRRPVPSSARMIALKPAIFLDRDGVMIEDSHYLGDALRCASFPARPKQSPHSIALAG